VSEFYDAVGCCAAVGTCDAQQVESCRTCRCGHRHYGACSSFGFEAHCGCSVAAVQLEHGFAVEVAEHVQVVGHGILDYGGESVRVGCGVGDAVGFVNRDGDIG